MELIKKVMLTVFTAAFALIAAPRWETDFAKAAAEAKKTSKHMLINFTGSDWCPWCFKLRDEVFATSAFEKYAEKNLVLVEADFPRRKKLSEALAKQNSELAEKYGVPGFPTVIVITPNGELAGRTGYRPGGGDAYVTHLKEMITR